MPKCEECSGDNKNCGCPDTCGCDKGEKCECTNCKCKGCCCHAGKGGCEGKMCETATGEKKTCCGGGEAETSAVKCEDFLSPEQCNTLNINTYTESGDEVRREVFLQAAIKPLPIEKQRRFLAQQAQIKSKMPSAIRQRF
uniref:Metallothionein n=1 Tax=Plectus sambesii TaxID=2011161 RepID=A0A914VK05_9BILA